MHFNLSFGQESNPVDTARLLRAVAEALHPSAKRSNLDPADVTNQPPVRVNKDVAVRQRPDQSAIVPTADAAPNPVPDNVVQGTFGGPTLDEMKALCQRAIAHPKMGGPAATQKVWKDMGYDRLANGENSVPVERYGELKDKLEALLRQADEAA